MHLGRRRVELMFLGRAHTAGDIVAFVPDEQVMFTGDIVEYHSACYCGDGHFADWGNTLDNIKAYDVDAIAPGRGGALVGKEAVNRAIESTRDFVQSTYERFAVEPPASANRTPHYKMGDPPVRIMYGTAVPKFTVGAGTYQIEKPQTEPRFAVEASANARAAVQKGLVRPPSATMFNRTAFESPWTRHAREHLTTHKP